MLAAVSRAAARRAGFAGRGAGAVIANSAARAPVGVAFCHAARHLSAAASGGGPEPKARRRPRAMTADEATAEGVSVGEEAAAEGGAKVASEPDRAASAAAAAVAEAERAAAAAASGAGAGSAGPRATTEAAEGGGGGDASAPKPPPKPSAWYGFVEGVKDVIAVTLGLERRRNVGQEYDMGVREYPWIEYRDPATDKLMYSNRDTGVVTDIKPADFEARAKPTSRVTVNEAASAISVVKTSQSAWERTLESVRNAPLIASLLDASAAVADTAVGKKVAAVRARIADKVEDAREVWETSQHP